MIDLPAFETYMRYSSKGYGAHALRFFDAQGNVFWFSYKTLVAFKKSGGNKYVHENDWRQTTGKHLNAIDGGDKKSRLSASEFAAKFREEFPC